jgi:hypothetical protein
MSLLGHNDGIVPASVEVPRALFQGQLVRLGSSANHAFFPSLRSMLNRISVSETSSFLPQPHTRSASDSISMPDHNNVDPSLRVSGDDDKWRLCRNLVRLVGFETM